MKEMNEIKQAVMTAFGEKLLMPNESHLARAIVCHIATDAGIAVNEIAKSLGCSIADVVKGGQFCKNCLACHEAVYEESVKAVEAVLEKKEHGSTLIAKAEFCGFETFTEIDAGSASTEQLLLLTLFAWSVRGTVIGRFKTLIELPIAPSDPRVKAVMAKVNGLAAGDDISVSDAVAEIFADHYLFG